MARTGVNYMRVDPGFPGHEKAIKAGGDAIWLWLAMKAYAKREGTNGRIPGVKIGRLEGPEPSKQRRLAKRLVAVGLLESCGEDFNLHDYLDWEESAEQAEEKRAAARKRKRDWDAKQRAIRNADRECVSNAVTNADTHASVTASSNTSNPNQAKPNQTIDHLSSTSSPQPGLPGVQEAMVGEDANPDSMAAVRQVFEAWKLDTGHHKAKLDKKRAARIRARFREGFSIGDLITAINNRHRDRWLMGTDPKSPRMFDDLETLLRDTAQVERLIGLSEQPGQATGEQAAAAPQVFEVDS